MTPHMEPVRNNAVLLSAQIAQIISDRIQQGVYPLQSRLPGEIDLCDEFQVSRPTVRKGLSILEQKGLIRRQRPKGTFVIAVPASDERDLAQVSLPMVRKAMDNNPVLQVAMEEALVDSYHTNYFQDFSVQNNCSVKMIHWNSWYTAVESIVSMYMQHQMPDIFAVSNDTVGTFARMGIIRPLDSFIEPHKLADIKERCVKYGFGSYIYNGELYGYPYFSETRLLIYRKDHFANVGIPDPLEHPLTHDSFLEISKELSNPSAGLYAFAYPVAREPITIQSAMLWIIQRGGSLLHMEKGRIVPATEEATFKEALNWYVDLKLKHNICPPDLHTLSYSKLVHKLKTGSISMFVGTPNTYKFLVDSSSGYGARYGFAPLPSGPANNFTFMGGMPLCISSGSRYPELAWKLISYMSTWDVLSKYCSRMGCFLPIECYDLETIRSNVPSDFQIAMDVLETAVPYVYPVGYNDCLDLIKTGFWEIPMAQMLEMLLCGKIDVENAARFLSFNLRPALSMDE